MIFNFKSWIYPSLYSARIDFILFMLRLVFSTCMLTHGFRKFNKLIDGNSEFGDPIGLGPEFSLFLVVFAEFFCAILIIFGLFTRLAVIPIIITMLVVIFIVHGADPFGEKELPIIYLCGFYSIYLAGPGKLSLDHKIFYKETQS